jgi:hypothetical protein
MKRTLIGSLGIAILALGLSAAEDTAAPKKAGYALLDTYIRAFQEIAALGTRGESLEANLEGMAAEAKRAREAAEIDRVFFSRFARILALTKLLMKPDPGGILMPVIDREIADFLRDVTGEDVAARTGPAAVGQVANAIAEELVNLQVYLDTLDMRQAMRKKLDEGMTPRPKKK